jgi:glycogen phosphorylase
MKPKYKFNVTPSLPSRLETLRKLAYNIHWDWNVETKDLFRRLDADLWEKSKHNPAKMLGVVSQSRLQELAEDEGFIAHMERAESQLDSYLQERTWYRKHRNSENVNNNECFAYFCAEYGLTHCLPIYSGGLGVLAGDHLKSASDLGLPLVAVGLLYQEGYFSQKLNADGWQIEDYPVNDFYTMPIEPVKDQNGQELRIAVEYPGRIVYARAWKVQVGTVPLYLLDTNVEPNSAYDHDITDELYGGDLDTRIHQEIMLGIGGIRLLKALGIKPTAYHLNEGHSGFLILERIKGLMEDEGLTFEQAKQFAESTQIFTTHTPVSAGFDMFPPDKALHYVGHYAEKFGLGREEFLALGRENTGDLSSPFSMAGLALKTASFVNGVAKLHGKVSREMFHKLWEDFPIDEVPITSITNGVHARSCVAKSTQELYDRYLGITWSQAGPEKSIWHKVSAIPDEELWRNHDRCRAELVMFVREKLVKHLKERNASGVEIHHAQEVLDPTVLTIGFARRFATYKRATLFMRNLDRIKRILFGDKNRRVQFVIAGKAHPKDEPGKQLIKDIVNFTQQPEFASSIVFIPDYDIHVSRMMVSGCDVWLNTPRRPREASGTSGMKAAMNGLLNLSILDGWWDEAEYHKTGWAIGTKQEYDDQNYQDEIDANSLYELLEREIVPLFYDRDKDGLPRQWVAKMKDAIRYNCPTFNTARMVRDYAENAYFPASDRFFTMYANKYAATKELAQWQHHLSENWYNITIADVNITQLEGLEVNKPLTVTAKIDLGELTDDDVQVELYQGDLNEKEEIVNTAIVLMQNKGKERNISIYQAETNYSSSGLKGISVRIFPKHKYLSNCSELGLILWA